MMPNWIIIMMIITDNTVIAADRQAAGPSERCNERRAGTKAGTRRRCFSRNYPWIM